MVTKGLLWEVNPGPLAPEARIIPLDQAADGMSEPTVASSTHASAAPRSKGCSLQLQCRSNVRCGMQQHVQRLPTPQRLKICRDPGSNRGPSDLRSDALATELSRLPLHGAAFLFKVHVAVILILLGQLYALSRDGRRASDVRYFLAVQKSMGHMV